MSDRIARIRRRIALVRKGTPMFATSVMIAMLEETLSFHAEVLGEDVTLSVVKQLLDRSR